jgi:hypothetical protein
MVIPVPTEIYYCGCRHIFLRVNFELLLAMRVAEELLTLPAIITQILL